MGFAQRTVTVEDGETLSPAVDLAGGKLVAVSVPTLDADCDVQFLAAAPGSSVAPTGNAWTNSEIEALAYQDVHDEAGARYTLDCGAAGDVWIGLDKAEAVLKGARFIKLELTVQATADRTFTLVIAC